ncbi:peptidylprolyl isomerase [Cohnella zeiphila]|uniref:peptidylprolyl isomerase n=1 Tax=Cohnella zeiphila TaxID=2761120 RepID=A0A7X0SSE0_9BACL|nr:peptidylprolyl isomerase [Cohnella zeiphila]MBB6735275.1 peptidyl-prolyl cis-trans isomerase [Cohnella zeiphila]
MAKPAPKNPPHSDAGRSSATTLTSSAPPNRPDGKPPAPPRPAAGTTPVPPRPRKRRLRGAVLAASALLLAAVAIAATPGIRHQGGEADIVATVNGEPIARQELLQAMREQKAKTAAYYRAQRGADAGPDFWTAPLRGEAPIEKLKRDALAQTVRLKVQQMMARQEGLTDDISYASVQKRLKAENERREKAGSGQSDVYGPRQYSEATYYSLLNSNLLGDLKTKLEGKMTWTDDQLHSYYEAHRADFADRDAIRADTATVSFSSGSGPDEADAEKIVREIADGIDQGRSLAEAAKSYEGEAIVGTVSIDADTAREISRKMPLLASKLQRLQAGQSTGPFLENGAYVCAVVVQRTKGEVRPFEAVKGVIEARLADEAYEALIDRSVAAAKVEIRPKPYGRLNSGTF